MGRRRTLRRAWLAGSCLAAPLVLTIASPALAQALPSGGSVSAGSAAIHAGAGNVTVNQASSRAVIDWKSFNVGAGKSVTFNQPGSGSAILNRVNGTDVSSIAGALSSNGQVFLVNRNGVIVTPTGQVQAGGGFVASTLDIGNADFMAGRLNFAGQGGSVVNQGTIVSNPGGAIALLGSSVSNTGLISAPLGKVAMGSGQQATLDFSGDGLLQVAIPADMALVSNSGRIVADGGSVVMRAATAKDLVRQVVNMSGVIQARGVSGQDGSVTLDGGQGGQTVVSGAIDVSGPQTGGQVDVTGGDVSLQGARVTANGADRGGLVRIGGAFQGGATPNGLTPEQLQLFLSRFGTLGALAAADTTAIDASSLIDVSGGKVGGAAVVWSSTRTSQQGRIVATGQSGGAVETSSQGVLDADITKARVGPGGVLLLDPQDIEVDDHAFFVNTSTTPDTASAVVNFSDNPGTTSLFDASDLLTLVQGGADLILKASRDINWNATQFDSGLGATVGNVSLYAGRSVSIGGFLTVGNANLTIVANDTAADGVVDADRSPGAGGIDTLNGFLQAGIGSGTSPGKGNISLTVSTGAGNTNNTPGNMRLGPIQSTGGAITISNSGQSASKITFFPDINDPNEDAISTVNVTATGAVTITGPFQWDTSGGLTISGSSVNWTDEDPSTLAGFGGAITFIENGVTTRYGLLGSGQMAGVSLGAGGSSPQYSITYGDAIPSATAHLTSGALHGTDTLATVLAGLNLSADFPAANSAAGNYSVTTSATLNTGSVPAGYFYNLDSVTETLAILRKTVTPTVSNGSYVYGSPTSVVSLAGVINGDAVAPTVNLGATPTTLVANGGGFGFATGTSAGGYGFTLTGLTGSGASNYSLDLSGTITGTLTVSAKPLTYTVFDTTSTYGTLATPSVFLAGVVGSDDVAAGTIDVTANSVTNALAARTPAGSYTMSLASLSGTTAGDYVIASSGNTDAALTVSPLALTYSVTPVTSTYGTLASVATPVLSGVLGGDTVTVTTLLGGQALTLTTTTPAGTYAITPQLGGPQAGDYTIASSGNTTGALTIDRKAITATLSDTTQTYGSQTTGAVTLAGLVSGDEALVTPVLSDGTNVYDLEQTSGAAYAFDVKTSVGSRTVSWNALGGAAGANYTVTPNNTLNLTVSPKTITYSIDDTTEAYHVTAAPPTLTFTGVLSGDDVSAPIVATIAGTSTVVTLSNSNMPAGTYDLSVAPGSLTGFQASDYALATTGNTDGSRTVTPRTITYSVGSATSTYGTLATLPTPSLGPVDGGDTVNGVLSVELSGSPISLTSKTAAGSYVLAVTGLTGAQAGDYVLASTGNSNGALTINPLAINALVGGTSSTYGTAAVLNNLTTLSGALSGDDVSAVVSGCVIGSSCAFTFTPGTATAAGTYTLRATGLTGAAAGDYVLASTGNVDGSLVISPKPLTYTVSPASWVYGDVSTQATTPTLTGVINGDLVSGVIQVKDAFNDFVTLQYGSPAGSYSESVTGLTGPGSSNYVLASSGNANGTVTITPKPLQGFAFVNGVSTVTYGSVTPSSLPIGTNLQGVIGSDQVSAVLSTPTLTTSGAGYLAAGSYSFTIASLSGAAAPNYSLGSSTTATLTIAPKALSPGGISNINSTYGTLATLQVPQLAGLLAGDNVSGGTYTVTLYGSSTPVTLSPTTPAGDYTVSIATLTGPDAGNYTAGSGSATLVIAPKPLTYTASNVSSTYGALAVIPAITLNGVVGSDDVHALDSASPGLTATTPAGTTTYGALSLAGAAAGNYVLATSGNQQGTLTINPKTLTYSLTSSALTATYGDAIANPLQLHGVVGGDDVSATLWAQPTGAVGNYYQFGGAVFPDATTYKLLMFPNGSNYILNGAQASDYVLPYDHLSSLGTLTVSPRTITYTTGVGAATQTYGQTLGLTSTIGNLTSAPFAFTYVADGSGGSTRDIDNTTLNLPVGSYTIGVRPSGTSANNYVVATTGNSAAPISITPKPITASYDNSAPVYGTPFIDMYSLPGLVAGDTVEPVLTINGQSVTLTPTSPGYGMSLVTYDVGAYPFTLTGLTGAQAGNYTLANAGTQTSFGVQPKTITYSIAPETVEYGSFPLPAHPDSPCDYTCLTYQQDPTTGKVTFNGILPGDVNRLGMTVLLSNGSSAFPYAVNTPVGTYSQIYDGLTGAAANDYVLAPTGNTSGALTIQPVWVMAAIAGGSRVYNGTLTGGYSILGTPGAATVSIGDAYSNGGTSYANVGFLPGDDVQVVVALYNQDGTVYTKGEPVPVGNYLLEPVGLSGVQASNYRLIPVVQGYNAGSGSQAGQLAVVDSSLFQFTLLSSNPNQTGYYTPPAAVTTQPPVSSTQISGSASANASATGSTSLTPISGSAKGGAQASAQATADLSSEASVSAQADSSTSAAASFNPRGVTVTANAQGGVSVTLSVGPVSETMGADASATSNVSLVLLSSTPNLKVTELAQAGVSDTVAVGGNLGGGVSGSASNTNSVYVEARSQTQVQVKDGALTISENEFVGAGASTSVTGSATVGVYSPGSLGLGASSTSGYSDGTVTIGFSLSVSIGIGGLNIAPSLSFPAGDVVDAVSGLFGGGGSSCDASCQAAAALQAKVNQAESLRGPGGNPTLAEMAYLSMNPDVVTRLNALGQDDSTAASVAFQYQVYGAVPQDLNSIVSQEQALVNKISSSPGSVTAADVQQVESLRNQEASEIGAIKALGGQIQVQNGAMSIVAVPPS